jgi:hypothetical protein
MANICSNEITFNASPEAITWLQDELSEITNISDYALETKAVMDKFSGDDSFGYKSLGSKYVYIYDFHRNTENELSIACESAWNCPTIMIEQITNMLIEKSPDYPVKSNGRYWEEGVGFLGIFTCDKDGYKFVQEEFPSEYYESNDEDLDLIEMLEPIFTRLELN